VYELLEMSQALTEALQADDPQLIDKLAREQIGRRTLAHAAVTMVLDGRTTAAEAMTIAE
jgi:MSHA biogenesis protein MshE